MEKVKTQEYTLQRDSIEIKIDGTIHYLVEIDGSDRDLYMNFVTKKLTFNAEGKPSGMDDISGMYNKLVSLCLRKKLDDRKIAFTMNELSEWPSKMLESIFKQCQVLCGIGTEVKDIKEKNS